MPTQYRLISIIPIIAFVFAAVLVAGGASGSAWAALEPRGRGAGRRKERAEYIVSRLR